MKGILILIDGLGDLPVERLGGRTPLDAAVTPMMDALAGSGQYGLIDPIAPGVLPNTHSGAGMLLGLLPEEVSLLNRGPVEAAGLGLQLLPGDIAMRANFATLEDSPEGLVVTDRRAGRIRQGTDELAAALSGIELDDAVTAQIIPTEQHRGVLVFSGPGLNAKVSDTDPGDHAAKPLLRPCKALDPAAEYSAAIINRYSELARAKLAAHPLNRSRAEAGLPMANGLVMRGAGHPLRLHNLVRGHGIAASVISGCNTVKGLGRLLDFRIVEDPRFTADLDTDLAAKIQSALEELNRVELVFVHIKAPDICAHDENPEAKCSFLSKIDQALVPLAGRDIVIAVAADHTTDSNTGQHTADPVPALISGRGVSLDGGDGQLKFSERTCRGGNMTRRNSHEFLQTFLRVMAS